MTLRPCDAIPPLVSKIIACQGDDLTIGSYLPLDNAVYARVMNPIRSGDGSLVRWASLAREGFDCDAATTWNDLRGDAHNQPDPGSISPLVASTLVQILRRFTRTPQWWLPSDGAWAVGNDIFGTSVSVAGSEDLITELLSHHDLEAFRTPPSTIIVAEEFDREA